MAEPQFIDGERIVAIHDEQLRLYGGGEGVRDAGLIESAVVQPQNQYCYDAEADIFDLAATYAFGLSKNHGFIDGNKRVGLAVALAFLKLNGLDPIVPGEVLYEAMIALTEGRMHKDAFAAILAWGSITQWLGVDHFLLTAEEAAAASASLPEKNLEYVTAYCVDHITSKLRMLLIERCEAFCVAPRRVYDFLRLAEARAYPMVVERLRAQFGIPSDFSPGE